MVIVVLRVLVEILSSDGGEDCFDGVNNSDGINSDNDHGNLDVEDEERVMRMRMVISWKLVFA